MKNGSFQPRICFTAAALILHKKKVLFIKHKKLGIWFAPGGHIEPGELPHLAAEREAFEETGVHVTTFDPYFSRQSKTSQYLPSPFETNLHWVCRENFRRRKQSGDTYQPVKLWPKGCEQHLGFLYLARPKEGWSIKRNHRETDGVDWFSLPEIEKLQTSEDIIAEVHHAFAVMKDCW